MTSITPLRSRPARRAFLCASLLAASLAHAQSAPVFQMRVYAPGLAATAAPGAPPAVPVLSVRDASSEPLTRLVFPATPAGESSAAQRVTLVNSGTASLAFSAPASASAPFAVTASTCPASLAAGAACEVSVVFRPTAQQAYAGSSYLLGVSSSLGLRTVELEGVGVAPVVPVTIASLSYGGVGGASEVRLPVQGGAVTIAGSGFDATSTVSVGNGGALTPTAVSATSLSFQAPAGNAGTRAAVTVRTGEQSFVVDNALSYVVPAVGGVTPASGDTNGNLAVTVNGSGFLPGAVVKFGTGTATSVVVAADGNSLTARTPASTVTGLVTVTVTNPGGSVGTKTHAFSYVMTTQNVTIAANVSKYNLAAALGNPTVAKQFVVTINAGVVISSDIENTAAFDTGTLPAGSAVTIINRGHILGRGGRGGNASRSSVSAGWAGGDALSVRASTTLDNSSGNIWGGGGGGGGGAALSNNGSGGSGGGGAGGGAAGTGCDSTNTYCINGQAGSAGPSGVGGANGYNNFGSPYYAGRGGAYGQPGTVGTGPGGATPGSVGGAAGYAVRKNGFPVSFTAGNDATRVKGLVN